MIRTRRVIIGPWLVLEIKSRFRRDKLLSKKRTSLGILDFISKFLSF
jgi:hypothetical protein